MINSRRELLPAGQGGIDWWALFIYLLLVVIGWFNIYAAVYDGSDSSIFNMEYRYGMQLVWIGVSLVIATVVMLVDSKFYHIFSYPLYGVMIIVLLAVLVIGREVNGAKAWIFFGPIAIQPGEFAKLTTALAVARYMSQYSFSIDRFWNLVKVAAIIALPAAIIIMQNDTGSAMVYGAFLFMLFREGLNKWVYIMLTLAIILFLSSLMFSPVVVVIGIVAIAIIGEMLVNRQWKRSLIFSCALTLIIIAIYFGSLLFSEQGLSLYLSILIACIVSIPFILFYAYRTKFRNVMHYLIIFASSLLFASAVDYVFDNVMQVHQQKRILNLLGLESDLQKWGYNVNQSKIAIGSGGFSGKGFLNGTQTKFDFVPEQSTDFIFCTVGEEWGFVGSSIVVILFGALILRLMRMGERQGEAFGRVFCYSVAGIFFVHVLINIGMTIGIMPVIGIPLPFFSYGGSSFLAFTLLFFIALRLDAAQRESQRK